jgi:hypothetical protein
MFKLSGKYFSFKYYRDESIAKTCNWFYSLDCKSGEGLDNRLLETLSKIFKVENTPTMQTKKEFEFYLEFILKKCIYINRSFSDAIWFLSIWLNISPDTLLRALQTAELKQFFNRTEYDHDGDQWYFPKLLQIFSTLIEKKQVTENKMLDYLFETFDFTPEDFVREIIGYDRLEGCIKESPAVFKQALLSKMSKFVYENETIDIGLRSRKYLNDEIQKIHPTKKNEIERDKQEDGTELVAYI